MHLRLNSLSLATATLLLCVASLPLPLVGIELLAAQAQTTQDQKVEPDTLFQTGIEQVRKGEWRQALETYQRALLLTQKAGNSTGEAEALHHIASVYETQGQYENALKFYEQVLPIRREAKDKAGEAATLIGLGNTYITYIKSQLYYDVIEKPEELKSYQEVLKYYEQALVITREIGNRAGEAWSLNGIAMTYSALDKKEEALKHYEQALAIMGELGNRAGEATVLFNIGRDYDWEFDPQREYREISLDFYEKALAIVREIGHRPLEAEILYTIGSTYSNRDQKPETALEFYKQALPIVQQMGNRLLEEKVLRSIGSMHLALGYPQTAQEYQEQALAIRQEMSIHVFWPTHIVKKAILVTHSTPKKRPTLITLLEGEGLIHYRNGEAHAYHRRYQAALESYQQALAIVRQQENRPWEWLILNQMGTIYETLGQFQQALDSYKQSLAIRQEVDERAVREPIPHTIRVAYGTDVNVQSSEGIKLEDGITNSLIRVGEGDPITTPITTLEFFDTPEDIVAMEERGRRIEVIVGASGFGFTNNEEHTLTNMGDSYKALGQYPAALKSYEEALVIVRQEIESEESEEARWRRQGIPTRDYREQEQRIFRSMGSVYEALGQYQAALESYQQSLAIVNTENSGNDLVNQKPILLTQIGKAYENLGQYQAALEAYQQALAIARDPSSNGYYLFQENLIRRYGQEELFRRTRRVYEKPNQEVLLNSISTIYEKLGQNQAAQEYREQASAFKREMSNRSEEDITALKAILITEIGIDETKKPIVQINRLEGEAVALFASGNSYSTQGQHLKAQYQLALQSYQQALAIVRQQENRPWEAVILYQMGSVYDQLGQNQAAVESYQQALAIQQKIENRAEEKGTFLSKPSLSGAVYYEAVEIHFESGQITTFKPEGGVIFFAQKPEKMSADRLFKEGVEQSVDGQNERAIKTFETALLIYQQIGDKSSIAETIYEIGQIYNKLEEYQQALNYYQQALPLQQELGDENGEKASLNLMWELYYKYGLQLSRQGQYREALDTFQQALAIANKLDYREQSEWRTLNQIALTYTNLGEYELALKFYQQAVPISEQVFESSEAIQFNMGKIYESLGQYELALKSYQKALEISRIPVLLVFDSRGAIGNIAGEVRSLSAIGGIHSRLKNYELALQFYQEALAVLKTLDDKPDKRNLEGGILHNIGVVYLYQGKYEVALDFLQQGLTLIKPLGYKRSEAVIHSNIGKIYFEQEKYELALDFYQQALVIVQEFGNKADEGYVLKNIGYLLEEQNQPELAIIFFKQSVNAREAIRDNIKGLPQEFQQSYTETIAEDYRHLADLLIKQDRILEAQRVLDLLKVQELDDYLRNVRGTRGTEQGVPNLPPEQQIEDGYQEILSQAIALGKELTQLRDKSNRTLEEEQRIAQLVNAQEKITEDFNNFIQSDEVEALIGQLTSKTRKPDLVDDLEDFIGLQDNLKNLQQNAVLLYPLILDDRIELILTTPDSPPIRRTVPVTKQQLNQAIVDFRKALQNPTIDAKAPAQQLYNWLIKPLEADLTAAEAQTIIYAPDAQLRYIPLAALHDGEKWLVQRYRINNITAASLTDLNTQPQRQLQVLAGAFASGHYNFTVGGESFDFSGLPFAGTEVENLANTIPATTQFIDKAFTPQVTVPKMDDYSVVHLATHAAFVVGTPDESFILFGNGERITLRDIQTWSLKNVDLVVLSACETGIGGKLGNGEEILGLGYQMQRAGARAAIASLWTVDDGGTQALMNAFYTALQTQEVSKTEALRQAQMALITGDYQALGEQRGIGIVERLHDNLSPNVQNHLTHPYYWAPFILIGNGL
ncbi:MAG TPA: tetratricopeptide repeat protein [Coleofasciculaceae cyanobacterium]